MNLLIVDDEYYNVESVRLKLETKRPVFDHIFCAYNLKQALNIFNKYDVSIMICDIEMPGGSGLELLDHIRRRELDTVCIFLTAYAKFEYISQAMKLSSIDYLLKPVEEEQLLLSVDKATAQFEKQQKAARDTRQIVEMKKNELTLLSHYWHELLSQNKLSQLETAVLHYLLQLRHSQTTGPETLRTFYETFLHLLEICLKDSNETEALALLTAQCGSESEERACSSVSALSKWVPGILALFQNCRQKAADTDNAIAAVKAYIYSHLDEKLDRDMLAARVYLSPDYLSHCFKQQTGLSLTNYIIEERIQEAKRLLSDKHKNIRDIAIACGFQNISYFTRQFKKSTGMTPREYRSGEGITEPSLPGEDPQEKISPSHRPE